jgi:hypothetical protein
MDSGRRYSQSRGSGRAEENGGGTTEENKGESTLNRKDWRKRKWWIYARKRTSTTWTTYPARSIITESPPLLGFKVIRVVTPGFIF